jgi:hypothetical protein
MGLDQYLYASKYVSSAEWRPEEVRAEFNSLVASMDAEKMVEKADIKSASIQFRVGYWRKANQIHGWFVDNVQGGNDDCREYIVSRDQLHELRELCKTAKREKNGNLISPREGFFFGSSEVDEYYWQDIDHTIEVINHVLKNTPEDYEFIYSSSW